MTNAYESGVAGSTGAGYAELILESPANGWYLIYAGGTDDADIGGLFDLTVDAEALEVPGLSLLGMLFLSALLIGLAIKVVPKILA